MSCFCIFRVLRGAVVQIFIDFLLICRIEAIVKAKAEYYPIEPVET